MSGRKMVGFDNFVRHNPNSDKFEIRRFHCIEFWCSVSGSIFFRISFILCYFNFRMLPVWPDASCMALEWILWRSLTWPLVSWSSFPFNLCSFNCLGNKKYASYAVQSGEMVLVFSAPYNKNSDTTGSSEPHANFNHEQMQEFIASK